MWHGLPATLQVTNSNGKLLCGHLMPTEYADYVTFVFGFVHVWCCHKFECLCIKCVVEGQRAGTCNSGLCGFHLYHLFNYEGF